MAFDRDDRSVELAALLVIAMQDGADPVTLRRRLRDADLGHMRPDADECRRLLDLGRELDVVFGRRAEVAVAEIDRTLATLEVRPRLVVHDGRPPHLHFERDRADLVERSRVNTILGLARFAASDGPGRLGRCTAEGCERVYVDVSRAGRRRFCTTACANRTRVAEHRARRRGQVTS